MIAIVAQFALGGKAYYPGGAYTFLLAAGCVPLERWLAARKPRAWRPAGALLGAAMLVGGGCGRADHALGAARPRRWPRSRCRRSTTTWRRPSAGRSRSPWWPASTTRCRPAAAAATTILAGNYGEAGALDRYGPGDGLPPAFSGANNFWYWGPPPARDRSAIAVNVDPALLRRLFTTVRQVAVFRNGLGVSDDEQGATVYRASGLRTSWAKAWPLLRNFS